MDGIKISVYISDKDYAYLQHIIEKVGAGTVELLAEQLLAEGVDNFYRRVATSNYPIGFSFPAAGKSRRRECG